MTPKLKWRRRFLHLKIYSDYAQVHGYELKVQYVDSWILTIKVKNDYFISPNPVTLSTDERCDIEVIYQKAEDYFEGFLNTLKRLAEYALRELNG
jgi:hypothetical protein